MFLNTYPGKAFSLLFFNPLYTKNEQLNIAKQEFLSGNYEKSIAIAANLNTTESKIFQSRAMSVYAHFFLEEDAAKQMFIDSYELAKESYLKNLNNAEAYVEAAHALGMNRLQVFLRIMEFRH